MKHPIRGCADQCGRCRLLPREMRGLGENLMGLDPRELAERSKVCVVAVDPGGRSDHRVASLSDPRIIRVPPTRMSNDMLPDLEPGHVASESVDDSRRV